MRLEVRDPCDLLEGHADRRRATHAGPASGHLDVFDCCLEFVGDNGRDAFAQDRRCLPNGACRHRAAAAACSTSAETGECRVALDRVDVLNVDAERVGSQLNNSCLDAVAGGAPCDVDVDLS